MNEWLACVIEQERGLDQLVGDGNVEGSVVGMLHRDQTHGFHGFVG